MTGMKTVAVGLIGAALGVGGTLGVQAATDDSAASKEAVIHRAYQRCMSDLAADTADSGSFDFDGSQAAQAARTTAQQQGICRREAADVAQ